MDEIAATDWVLTNSRILTLDPRRPVVAALAIQGDRITATGSAVDVRGWRGRRTRVLDLRGATVVPGLVDAHAHLDREGLKFIGPSLARCRSIADIQALVRRQAARRPAGEWIVTMPVGTPPFYLDAPAGLAERRWPTRADLDAAAPDHPVYIRASGATGTGRPSTRWPTAWRSRARASPAAPRPPRGLRSSGMQPASPPASSSSTTSSRSSSSP